MATVVEFTSPATAFPLGTVFENLPDVTVELERIVPRNTLTIPYFWVRGAAAADVVASFESHAGIDDMTFVDSVDDESLMRAEWKRGYVGVLRALAETDLVVLSAVGTRDGWTFEVRGEGRAAVSDFRTYCQDNDVPIDITSVHELMPTDGAGYGLTAAQEEALLAAFDRGYYDSPRAVTLAEIAEDLGVTQQSLSTRLKRAQRQLVAATLRRE